MDDMNIGKRRAVATSGTGGARAATSATNLRQKTTGLPCGHTHTT